ncbi:isoprenoid synthase domain-containing protein [Suillus subalutaceus]|uniref:isoprenoid synthase domain-containing protein n=1 Tax=Suillus subalutaceus TaxID=48586 RepID=UPI001B88409B|nr:isoprenoid synthase domain-containing protein [Suillus subalutaceus]KAG1848738.1 isoprenoid synthase domain-containing protein [Suillus subalutaceus]KAG1882585.1 isoprenoid synthase domain-containing protein [Suillus subluteus]
MIVVPLSLRSHCLQRLSSCRRLHTGSALRSEAGISNPAEYCKDLVRKHDYEGYLTSQLYPKRFQGGYFALRAFYIELATVREAVSQTTLGQARLVFWRDAMKDIYNDKPPRHPIALAIHEATRDNHLPLYHFNRIIEAREQELHNQTHLTLESMTSHAESTSSTFLYLLLAMLNLPSSTLAHAASHIGVAQSLTTLLRALPFHASKGVMVIPAEITAKHNVNQQEIFSKGESSHGLEDAVFELATVANDHLLTARDMFKESGGRVPPDAMPVFSAAIPVVSILSTLEVVHFNVFNPSLQIRDWRLAWQVWRSYYKRTF